MKNFTQQKWLHCLAMKKWESIGETENVDDMANQFSNYVNEALNEIAPVKTFSIKPGYM